MKRILTAFLIITVVAAWTLPAQAAPGPHIFCVADCQEADPGDEFTVTVGTRAMSICTFIGGIYYDSSRVELVSMSRSSVNLTSTDGASMSVSIAQGVKSNVGFVGIGASEREYEERELVTLTFRAIASGAAVFTLYEDTDGTDETYDKNIEGVTVNITGTAEPATKETDETEAAETSTEAETSAEAAETTAAKTETSETKTDETTVAKAETSAEAAAETTVAKAEETGTSGSSEAATQKEGSSEAATQKSGSSEAATQKAGSSEAGSESEEVQQVITAQASEEAFALGEKASAFPVWIIIGIAVAAVAAGVIIIIRRKK